MATARQGVNLLSIELCQHDDEFANGGYEFWLWLHLLMEPPPTGREVIGVHGLYRRDSESVLVTVDADGVVEGERPRVTFGEIRETLRSQARASEPARLTSCGGGYKSSVVKVSQELGSPEL
ncbi:MAG: hypothetical protein WA994_01365 [Ornithinimicrobium sp.]